MNHAFSLFELLVVMAIIAILEGISYPLHTQHIARVNCKQAQVALLDMANKLEQEYSFTHDYSQLAIESLTTLYKQLPYQFSLHASKHSYQLTAMAEKANGLPSQCRRIIFNHAENSVLTP